MRNTKRILSLLLTIAMLASCMVVSVSAADAANGSKFSDVPADSAFNTAVETLNLMGVINGYEDGSFRPNQNVTRAEFTAMLMRTLNYGSLGSSSASELPFSDVSDTDSEINWSIPNINTAYGMNIINGYEDGTFRPTANVAYEEAIKMIVCTLGYTDIGVDTEPWYSLYLSQANRLGITRYASTLGTPETPATRACIAQMLYDSLEANLCEQGTVTDRTILTAYLGYTKGTGVIASDGVTSLTQPDSPLGDSEVQIATREGNSLEARTYRTTNTDLKNYLGHQIEFYYQDNGSTRTLAFYVRTDNKELTLDASDIERSLSTDTQLRYYASDTTSTTTALNLDAENVVIFNGKLYGASAAQSRFSLSMLPKVGTVTLLDSNSDGRYDLVKIQSYEIYYVSSKVSSEYSIIDDATRLTDKRLVLNVNDNSMKTTIVDAKGKEVSYSSIATGNIICLAKSRVENGGNPIQTAVVINDTVTGTITATDADSITINGTKYEYSDAAPWMPGNSGTQAAPALQESGTYSKDINGKIVAYKKNAVSDNISYGYLMGVAKAESSFSDEKSARILTQNNTQITPVLDAATQLNGRTYDSTDELVAALEQSARIQNTDADVTDLSVQQLIKYSTRTSGGVTKLSRIYTAAATTRGETIASDTLFYYSPISGATSMDYTQSARQLSAGRTSVNVGSAIVFKVPSKRSAYSDYSKSTSSSAFRNNGQYFVEAFDVTSTNTAKAIVCYGSDSSSKVDDYTPVSVIASEIETMNNPDTGTNMSYLNGYSSSTTSAKGTLANWLSPESTWSPSFGDIFRAGTDRDGYAKILSENVLYKVNGGNTYGQFASSSNLYTAEYAVILGSVAAIDEDSISILPKYLAQGDKEENITADAINLNISSFSGARVLNYDNTNPRLQINDVSSDYEGIIKGLAPYTDGESNPSKVLVYMYEGNVKLLCVLGEDIAK